MRSHLLATFLLLFSVSVAQAQQADTTRYFPLEIGNTWTYITVFDPPGLPYDTTWYDPNGIEETVAFNDTLYYVAPHPFALADTLREDENGRIWARVGGSDVLLFDFTLEEGETYTFDHNRYQTTYEVTIQRNLTWEKVAGRFENVVRFYFDVPGSIDEERTYTFAPGAGMLYAVDGGGDWMELHTAFIGGRTITSFEWEIPVDADFYAYPNPFKSSTAIVVAGPTSRPVRVSVYDVQGRRVALLTSPGGDAATARLVWSPVGLPAGLYYARVEQGGYTQTIGLVQIP